MPLKDYPELTTYEALKLANQMAFTDSIIESFHRNNNLEPAFLEAIAIALGYDSKITVAEAINNIAEAKT